MREEPTGGITKLLGAVGDGDAAARSRLLDVMYGELKRIARRHMRHERRNHTLQPSALVHEAYLRLLGGDDGSWQNRAHFLAHAARAMRCVLVDYARAHAAKKRGGREITVSSMVFRPVQVNRRMSRRDASRLKPPS
jgi:RNA polymerase sigma-70 factor (ECF subfamily)